MTWRVRVEPDDHGRIAVVFVTRRRLSRAPWHGVTVARVALTQADADEQLANARAKAASMARQITDLERAL